MRCNRCERSQAYCLCPLIKELETPVKFVFLMHPKEWKRQRTGTGLLAKLCLPGSVILHGVDFGEDETLKELLSDHSYLPFILFPSPDALKAQDLATFVTTRSADNQKPTRTLLIFLIDGTWSCAKKIMTTNAALFAPIPKLTFSAMHESIFTIKREPAPGYISTIESCYYLLKELTEASVIAPVKDLDTLMQVFKALIKQQLTAENERIAGKRPSTHPKNAFYTKPKAIPDYLK